MKTTTLRPGLLVSLKTSIQGNIKYEREETEQEHRTETGEVIAAWETKRTVFDAEERERSVKVRGKCRSVISATCALSTFGLLCPEDKIKDLDAAIADAQWQADEFNKTAKRSRISIYVIAGRIAEDDVGAVRAINSEIRDLIDEMERGIELLDPEKIRAAATKARSIGSMLTQEARGKVQTAINAARQTARTIVKAGDNAALEVDAALVRQLAAARTAFLDLDDEIPEVQTPTETGRGVDLQPASEPEPIAASRPQYDL